MTDMITGAAVAMAGLLLVFIGAMSTSFDSYQPAERRSVVSRYQRRVWTGFAGMIFAVAAAVFSLIAKWSGHGGLSIAAFLLLLVALGFVLWTAYVTASEVK